jgi:hypothetical protein
VVFGIWSGFVKKLSEVVEVIEFEVLEILETLVVEEVSVVVVEDEVDVEDEADVEDEVDVEDIGEELKSVPRIPDEGVSANFVVVGIWKGI